MLFDNTVCIAWVIVLRAIEELKPAHFVTQSSLRTANRFQLSCMHEIREIRAACSHATTPSLHIAAHMPDPRHPQPYYRCAVAVTYNFALLRQPYDPKWDRIAQPATDWQSRPLIVKQGTVLDYAAAQQHLLDYLALALQPRYTKRGPLAQNRKPVQRDLDVDLFIHTVVSQLNGGEGSAIRMHARAKHTRHFSSGQGYVKLVLGWDETTSRCTSMCNASYVGCVMDRPVIGCQSQQGRQKWWPHMHMVDTAATTAGAACSPVTGRGSPSKTACLALLSGDITPGACAPCILCRSAAVTVQIWDCCVAPAAPLCAVTEQRLTCYTGSASRNRGWTGAVLGPAQLLLHSGSMILAALCKPVFRCMLSVMIQHAADISSGCVGATMVCIVIV